MVKTDANRHFRKDIGYQIVFWTALFAFGLAKTSGEYQEPIVKEIFCYELCHMIFQVIGANFIFFVLIRKLFDCKKYMTFLVSLLCSLYLLGVFNRIFVIYLAEPFFINQPKDSMIAIFTDLRYLLFVYIFPIVTGSFIFIAIMYMLQYQYEKQNVLQLQQEKSVLELKVLKTQLNPHFLFNTLNNIYSLAIRNSEYTSASISRLSDILDYILHKGQKKLVPIEDELSIIDDYIGLEKLRYDDRLKITKTENITRSNTIPPLLYLSLVENAFKHGAEKTSNIVEIVISISSSKKQSIFKIDNTFFEKKTETRVGIGLKNIKQQLELYYRQNYTLTIKQEDNWFKVEVITPGSDD